MNAAWADIVAELVASAPEPNDEQVRVAAVLYARRSVITDAA